MAELNHPKCLEWRVNPKCDRGTVEPPPDVWTVQRLHNHPKSFEVVQSFLSCDPRTHTQKTTQIYNFFFFKALLIRFVSFILKELAVKKEKEKFTYCTGSQRVKHNNNDYLY